MALISLGSLAAAIFLGFFRKMNTGLVCIGFALLLGKLAGIPDKEIIGGFNYSLFLMLLGVTYLFGLAEWNETLKLLTKKITVLAGKRTYLIPVVMYLFATVLSALGPGTIPTTAIMMIFGMTLAVEMKINPAMLAAIIFLGAAGGGMSPLAATGIIGLNLCEEFGLTGIEAPLLVNGVFSSTVYAAVVYIAFGGYKLKSEKALKFSDTASFNRAQIITLLGICAMVGMVMIFKVNVGLALYSFNDSRMNAVWAGFTFKWYVQLFNNRHVAEALTNTLIIGFISTAVSTILGTTAALALHKYRYKYRGILNGFIYLPILIPEIVMGLSLLVLFSQIHLSLGRTSIILAHITFCLSFVVITVGARLDGLKQEYEEAAGDLYARPWQCFRYITLPLIMPGITAGALIAFTLSIDDFIISFFVAGPNSTTLPLYIYAMVKRGISPEINALSTLMIAAEITLILLADFFQIRQAGSGRKKEFPVDRQ